MPRKSDNIAIKNIKLDRRIKLTQEDKEEIKSLYPKLSTRKLALRFGVSRRSIQFVLDPAKIEAVRENYKKRGGWRTYFDKKKHNKAVKRHRDYKKDLYAQGLIGEQK